MFGIYALKAEQLFRKKAMKRKVTRFAR